MLLNRRLYDPLVDLARVVVLFSVGAIGPGSVTLVPPKIYRSVEP